MGPTRVRQRSKSGDGAVVLNNESRVPGFETDVSLPPPYNEGMEALGCTGCRARDGLAADLVVLPADGAVALESRGWQRC
jgi:hypothetical protein